MVATMNRMVFVKCVVLLFMEIFGHCLAGSNAPIGGHPIIGAIGGHPIITPQGGALSRCPWACSCSGLSVDCSHRGLTQVPRNLPTDAERV